jgi:hypothetical protein
MSKWIILGHYMMKNFVIYIGRLILFTLQWSEHVAQLVKHEMHKEF